MDYKIEKEPIMTKEEYDFMINNLNKRKVIFAFKRVFDVAASLIMAVILSPMLIIFSLMIFLSSGRPVFFTQERIGRYGKRFNIIKFRTMKNNTATSDGITLLNDMRITKVGSFLRKYRLDEFPQLFNILKGDMSFVGPRPDMPQYYKVNDYGYKCVLLVKPGVTGEVTLKYKGEDSILSLSKDPEKTYIEKIFPEKVKLNIEYIKNITLLYDLNILLKTVYYVFANRNYGGKDTYINNSEMEIHLNE